MAYKKKYDDTLMIVELSSHKIPQFKEVQGKDWIYFGEKNDYPKYLINLYNRSAKHNAIVNSKTYYIAGAGWGEIGNTVVGSYGETLNDITWKLACDLELFGAFDLEIIYKNGGGIANLNHLDFSFLRSDKENETFYYTSEWITKYGTPNMMATKPEDWEVYEAFDIKKQKGKQLLYYKEYRPGLYTYPLPSYIGANPYIELDFRIANYWYNRVKYGFMASAIINFYNGNPSAEEKKKLYEKIQEGFGGDDNSGNFILNFANNKDTGADVQQLTPPELGQEYEVLNKTVQEEIFSGHRITSPMLFGIRTPGSLGGRTELIEANELFQNNYVTPKQKIIEDLFNNTLFPLLKIKPNQKLQKIEPIGYIFSESVIKEYLPRQAITEMIASKMGIDLSKYPQQEKEIQEQNKFSKQEDISPCVEKIIEEGKSQEQAVAICISKRERGVLEELKKKKKKHNGKVLYRRPVTFEMSRDLKKSEDELLNIYQSFAKEPAAIIIGKPVVLPKGIPQKPTQRVSVVYSYEWIEGFSDADLITSREFCIDLRTMSNDGERWSRGDIDTISTAGYEDSWGSFGVDIWRMRGGWYTQPDGIHVPRCRHVWYQEILLETI